MSPPPAEGRRAERQRLVFGCLALFAVLALVVGLVLRRFGEELDQDYDRLRPEEAFRRQFQEPPPPGVAEIEVTGQVWIAGANVWMRFRAPRSVLQRLVSGYDREEVSRPSADLDPSALIANDPQSEYQEGLRRIRWDELAEVQRAEIYTRRYSGAYRYVVADQESDRVFVYYWSQ